MKKVISFLLVAIMAITIVTPPPAFAADDIDFNTYRSQVPIINIYGDGEPIYNAEGEKIFHFSEMFSMLTDREEGNTKEALIDVLSKFLIQGIAFDNWDPYYEALEKEIGDLFAECRLDNNGEKHDGSDVSQERRKLMAEAVKKDYKEIYGYYPCYQYSFWYDWRLDPMATADEFNAYIQAIKETTGAEKVAIYSKCLGTSVVMAYIAKYGLDDIHGISIDSSVSNGAEILSEPISGKFTIDGNAINRFMMDMDSLEMASIDSFINDSIDLAVKSGALDAIVGVVKEELYAKVLQGVTSALALSTFYTWPNYWSCVASEDYEQAKALVFGDEGSAKRTEYAGLIAKLDNYDEQVRQRSDELMRSIKEQGANIVILSKYGYQLAPICQSRNEVADQFVTVKNSSYGATTGTVYQTLSKEYIAAAKAEGREKYISPDKLIDASTCMYPDYTWFLKGASHSAYTIFQDRLLYLGATAPRQVTIDDFDWTQFVVYDIKGDLYDMNSFSPMTVDNCHTEAWDANENLDKVEDKYERLFVFLYSLISWLISLFQKIGSAQ